MNDLQSIGALLRATLGSLGLDRIDLTMRLMKDWDEIAGPPWAGASNPVVVKDGELIVEATSPGSVRFLRYSIGELIRRLDEQVGDGVVSAVTVRPPPARNLP